MGRKAIGKKPMTAAERQRRRRRKVNRDQKAAEVAARQAANLAKLHAQEQNPPVWTVAAPALPLRGPADELAAQIEEVIRSGDGVTIADLRDALDLRFGPAAGRA